MKIPIFPGFLPSKWWFISHGFLLVSWRVQYTVFASWVWMIWIRMFFGGSGIPSHVGFSQHRRLKSCCSREAYNISHSIPWGWYIYTYTFVWFFMVHVGSCRQIYQSHGCYGYWIRSVFLFLSSYYQGFSTVPAMFIDALGAVHAEKKAQNWTTQYCIQLPGAPKQRRRTAPPSSPLKNRWLERKATGLSTKSPAT